MSVKSESKSVIDEDVESGQCSEDEVQHIKTEKKSKKKKSLKSRKSRKRKHSSSSSSGRPPSDFFNPYCFNPDKFVFKAEYNEVMEGLNDDQCITMDKSIAEDIITDTFNNLSNKESEILNNETSNPTIPVHCKDNMPCLTKDIQMQQSKQMKQTIYFVDVSGIDTVSGDLFHYLSDLGLSSSLVDDLLKVMTMDEEENEEQEHDEDDRYEEEMINDIPIIDQSQHNEHTFNEGYSPEHISELVEPYKPQNSQIAYAPQQKRNDNDVHVQIIDPLSIPAVGPRDPRLINSKTLLQSKSVTISKPSENVPVTADTAPVMNIDWETTVTNVVKTHLTLYLTHNDINKEEYKSILKRAVNKILMCGERKLETDKISKFLHSYVTMTQKSRVLNNV